MPTTRSTFAALFAVALALPFAACDGDRGAFEETPPAAEEVYPEDTGIDEEQPPMEQPPMEQPPMEQPPMEQAPPEGGTMEPNP